MEVRISPDARRELQELVRRSARDSPRTARLIRDRFAAAIEQLTAQPESGRPGRVDGTRALAI